MNLNAILNQFQNTAAGNAQENSLHNNSQNQQASGLSGLMDKVPGGLASGAAAGGLMALLMSNKSARKIAGKAAGYGGAAVLGGLAFKALSQWKNNKNLPPIAANNPFDPSNSAQANAAFNDQSSQPKLQAANNASLHAPVYSQTQNPSQSQSQSQSQSPTNDNAAFQLTLIKSMIAASKADGQIDEEEQKNIFDAIKKSNLSNNDKTAVFDLLRQPIYIEELSLGADTLEQKAEVYLAACLAINIDTEAEEAYLNKLATALELPTDLALQLRAQAA